MAAFVTCTQGATGDKAKLVSAAVVDSGVQQRTPGADSRRTRVEPADWVGWRYTQLPDSAQPIGGALLTVRDTVYNTEFFQLGTQRLLWLARGRGAGRSGAAEWTVLAALRIEPVEGENLFAGTCRLAMKRDPEILALGFHEDVPVFTHFRLAWRINVVTKTFDVIPTRGIDCPNPDSGGWD